MKLFEILGVLQSFLVLGIVRWIFKDSRVTEMFPIKAVVFIHLHFLLLEIPFFASTETSKKPIINSDSIILS